jgi:4a-hydroxytetrahydrobiopterin dehydratase
MSDLADQNCVPCRGGVPPLRGAAIDALTGRIDSAWKVVDEHHLERTIERPDFVQALELTNRIGELAEAQGHHPDLHLSWGKVRVEVWTHKIDGLTESDFVLAAKIDRLA